MKSFVSGEEFLQDERQRPAVQQDVMVGPHELVGLIVQAEEGQADQGRPGQIEALAAILAQISFKAGALFLRRKFSPILLDEGHRRRTVNDLDRLFQPLPGKGGAQDGVPVDHELPGSLEGGHVQLPTQDAAQLLHVDARSGRVEAVEQHALLHRRERVEDLDVFHDHESVSSGASILFQSFPIAPRISSRSPCSQPKSVKSEGVKPPAWGSRQWAMRAESSAMYSSASARMVSAR